MLNFERSSKMYAQNVVPGTQISRYTTGCAGGDHPVTNVMALRVYFARLVVTPCWQGVTLKSQPMLHLSDMHCTMPSNITRHAMVY